MLFKLNSKLEILTQFFTVIRKNWLIKVHLIQVNYNKRISTRSYENLRDPNEQFLDCITTRIIYYLLQFNICRITYSTLFF